jgi:hypothetical protein
VMIVVSVSESPDKRSCSHEPEITSPVHS